MHLLEAISEDRTVCFVKHIGPDMDRVIRCDTDNEAVECGMVELTQSNTVGDLRLTFRTAIGNYMGCVKELVMP